MKTHNPGFWKRFWKRFLELWHKTPSALAGSTAAAETPGQAITRLPWMFGVAEDTIKRVVALAEHFKGMPDWAIDTDVECAKMHLRDEREHFNRCRRRESFAAQVAALMELECAGMSAKEFIESYVLPLENCALSLPDASAGHLTFLIVVPERFVNIPAQLKLVRWQGQEGYSRLNLGGLSNIGEANPTTPYLIHNVCVSKVCASHNLWPGLTLEEGVALGIHFPQILGNDEAYALLGSKYIDEREDNAYIPKLGRDPGERPMLAHDFPQEKLLRLMYERRVIP